MKFTKHIITAVLLTGLAAGVQSVRAQDKDEHKDHKHDKSEHKDAKAKPYPLDKCIVSDEKLGEHGKPYVFTYKGQEIKMCCKDCLKDFNKEPAKYLKKITDAPKKDAPEKK